MDGVGKTDRTKQEEEETKQSKTPCSWKCPTLGLTLIILGSAMLLTFPTIYKIIVRENLRLGNGTDAFQKWSALSKHTRDFYFFNWTNPEDIYNISIKPKFVEVGPYRFIEYFNKTNISFNDNGTITYKLMKVFKPILEEGTRPITDKITTLNAVPNTVAYQVRHRDYFTKKFISFIYITMGLKMHITKTVDELLFTGYVDPLLKQIAKIPFLNFPQRVTYMKNYTENWLGPFNFNSVVDENYTVIHTYNYRNRTDCFDSICGEVRGSTGEFMPMNYDTGKEIYFYAWEARTYVRFKFAEQFEYHGVVTNKYEAVRSVYENGATHKEETCFCNGECPPPGLLNVSRCNMDTPTFVSMPHFYGADESVIRAIDGMQPNKSKHLIYTSYEPFTGTLIVAGLKGQINMLVQPISGITMFANVPKYYIPIFYFNESLTNTEEVFGKLKLAQMTPMIAEVSSWLTIVLGGLIFSISIFMLYVKRIFPLRKKQKSVEVISWKSAEISSKENEYVYVT